MNEMTRLVQNHDYLTPRIAGKSGISKFKFYKYVRENGLAPVSRGVYSTVAYKRQVYTVKRELLDVGKIIVKDNDGNMIPMYDLERTICDLMRSRSSIEAQDFNSVLKTYVSRRDKDLNRLMEYAKLFRVDNVIRRYMGVLL